MSMNKEQLVKAMAAETGETQEAVKKFLASFENQVTSTIRVPGEKVVLTGFVTFGSRNVPERQRNNPKTKEKVTVEAHVSPTVKAGARLKAAVNET